MKIIFLDLDGVLNICRSERDEFGSLFHEDFVQNLKRIVDETSAKIVISSSWRSDGLDVMQKMWKHRNLPGDVIGVTCDCVQIVENGDCEFYDMVERGHEIQEWIDTHDVDNYVIIDDDNDMLQSQRNNFVRCMNPKHPDKIDIGYGLTKECANMAIKILNNE